MAGRAYKATSDAQEAATGPWKENISREGVGTESDTGTERERGRNERQRNTHTERDRDREMG